MTLNTNNNVNKQLINTIQDPTTNSIKQYLHRLVKEIKSSNIDSNQTSLLQETISGISNLLRDPSVHPKIKYNSHRIIMYLILLTDFDVYKEFDNAIYPILKANCMYNKGLPVKKRGQDFFKKSPHFTGSEVSAAQKNQIKVYGVDYIVFCLETIYMLDKWIPCDFQDDSKPSKYAIGYKNLVTQGVQFPRQDQFLFYKTAQTDQIQRVIREIQRQYESLIDQNMGVSSSLGDPRISIEQIPIDSKKRTSLIQKKNVGSKSNIYNQQIKLSGKIQSKLDLQLKSKMYHLQQQKNKLIKQIQIQRNFYEGELQKQRRTTQQNIKTYEIKIKILQQQIQKMREKIAVLQSKNRLLNQNTQVNSKNNTQSNDKIKDKVIEDLQINNKNLLIRIKNLQDQIIGFQNQKKLGAVNIQNSKENINQSASSMSTEIQKLKKQNRSLKAKLLTECSQSSQFNSKKSNAKTQNSDKQPQSLKFLGYEDGKSCFQPFYSNSSSQIKIRLRKAILRQKQLLYRDKMIEVGCITKIQGINNVRLVIVFTNISEKPLLNFAIDFVSREDLVVKLLQNTKNYLEISGQTKSQISVTINQIDFRCLLCSVRFNIDSQTQKLALIMPISKLKLAQQLVYTPIKKQQKLKKLQKVFKCDRKILPNLHKFKDYFDHAILEVDRTMHETYSLKMQFMGSKFYIQCDQIEGELRIAIKYYEEQDFSRAQKLLQQLAFLFTKN